MEKQFLTQQARQLGIKEAINLIQKSELRRCYIPMELAAGWPFISSKNDTLCMTLPYYPVKRTEKGIELYPISSLVTITLNTGRIVQYNCLIYDRDFRDILFHTSCGVFKHEAIASYTKAQYEMERTELIELYEELLSSLRDNVVFNKRSAMMKKMSILMEPGQYAMYCRLAPKFFANYCGSLRSRL